VIEIERLRAREFYLRFRESLGERERDMQRSSGYHILLVNVMVKKPNDDRK
jgi:hypothetical protein